MHAVQLSLHVLQSSESAFCEHRVCVLWNSSFTVDLGKGVGELCLWLVLVISFCCIACSWDDSVVGG